MKDPLRLATKYAGFASIEAELLSGLENLELVRSAVMSAIENMNYQDKDTALSLVKRFMHQQRDISRSEIQKIRGVLSGELESYDD